MKSLHRYLTMAGVGSREPSFAKATEDKSGVGSKQPILKRLNLKEQIDTRFMNCRSYFVLLTSYF